MKTRLALIACALVLTLAAACSTGKKAAAPTTLNGTEWKLESVISKGSNEMIIPDAEKTPTLLISTDGKMVSGFGGCNRFSGVITTLKFPHIKFGPLISTKMFCDSGSHVEDALLAALEQVESYTVVGGELRLIRGTSILATFTK